MNGVNRPSLRLSYPESGALSVKTEENRGVLWIEFVRGAKTVGNQKREEKIIKVNGYEVLNGFTFLDGTNHNSVESCGWESCQTKPCLPPFHWCSYGHILTLLL